MYKKEVFLEIDTNLHSPIQSMEADSNSRLIRFNLTNNYMPFRLTGKKVIFKAVKPDGTDIVNDCIIIDEENGIVEVEITKQINAISGRVNCQLSIIGADDYVLKTKKFIISVDSKLNQSGVVSSKEYKTLENALAKVQSIDENFDKVNTAILELATKGTTVEVIERATRQEIDRQIADGTIAHLTIQDGSVTPEKTSFYGEVASHEKVLKNAQTDYMGNARGTVKEAMDSNVDWLLGEINTVHYDGQHITATDSIEGQCKSAILTGNTLVNLSPFTNKIALSPSNTSETKKVLQTLNQNTKYILIFNINNSTSSLASNYIMVRGYNTDGAFKEYGRTIKNFGNGRHYILLESTQGNVERIFIGSDFSCEIDDTILAIYQDGMENWDIPYFEGMTSVKMPVLKATGKNTFNIKNKGAFRSGWYSIPLESPFNGEVYVKGDNSLPSDFRVNILAINKNEHTLTNDSVKGGHTGYYQNLTDIEFHCPSLSIEGDSRGSLDDLIANGYIVIELGGEPYKSNILSTPEDVTLRGIGEVKDELDCLTGEKVERIGEVVYDGSDDENWDVAYINVDGLIGIATNIPSDMKYLGANRIDGFINDRLKQAVSENMSIYSGYGGWRMFAIYMDSSTFDSAQKIKQWLSQNPITVQYELDTESIKTVDLSDNHVYSYKDVTHYDCSSAEGSLVPTLSIDVPTNLPAVVTRQRATIQELEKENVALKNEIEETANSSVNGDLELMSSQFELDFRLFEIEMNLDMPMMATMRGVKSMAMTVYQQAKTLILAGKYEREDMEYKLNRYKAAGRITVEEYEELIALMDARELVD